MKLKSAVLTLVLPIAGPIAAGLALTLAIGSGCSTISTIAKTPTLDAYSHEFFPVGSGHELLVEQAGNPSGVPIIFMHGGPGDGTDLRIKRLFDPSEFRIITFDQRGAGKSKYSDFMKDNNLPELINDIEKIREHLKISKWMVLGGSWGSTLSLAYSEAHPDRVSGLITWGNFAGRESELPWLNSAIQSKEMPKRWATFTAGLTPAEIQNPALAYSKRLSDPKLSQDEKVEWARRWNSHEWGLAHAIVLDEVENVPTPATSAEKADMIKCASIESTYIGNDSFLTPETDLITHAPTLAKIPYVIIQGDVDHVCPIEGTATALHNALPNAEFDVVHLGGHSASGPRMELAVRNALAKLYSKVE